MSPQPDPGTTACCPLCSSGPAYAWNAWGDPCCSGECDAACPLKGVPIPVKAWEALAAMACDSERDEKGESTAHGE